MIEVALQSLIAGVVGTGVSVTPISETAPTPQILPRIQYTLIDDPPNYTDDGASPLRKAQYQLDSFAKAYTSAKGAILQIMTPASANVQPGLDSYRGTVANTQILRIYFQNQRTSPTTNAPGQNQAIARATVDVFIDYRELLVQPNFSK